MLLQELSALHRNEIDSEVLYLFFALTVKYAATLKQASTIELIPRSEMLMYPPLKHWNTEKPANIAIKRTLTETREYKKKDTSLILYRVTS